jgi:hypothetical protein
MESFKGKPPLPFPNITRQVQRNLSTHSLLHVPAVVEGFGKVYTLKRLSIEIFRKAIDSYGNFQEINQVTDING